MLFYGNIFILLVFVLVKYQLPLFVAYFPDSLVFPYTEVDIFDLLEFFNLSFSRDLCLLISICFTYLFIYQSYNLEQ